MNTVSDTRSAAMALTRERILDVASRQFMERWYDEVTLREVAKEANVALQTVMNHFGSKEGLFTAAAERLGEEIDRRRATDGDVQSAVKALVEDYEQTGDAIIRALAVEERVPAVRARMDIGRRSHREWVARTFARALEGLRGADRETRLAQLVAVTDVYTWKLLRRDRGFSRTRTAQAIQELVERLHDSHEEDS